MLPVSLSSSVSFTDDPSSSFPDQSLFCGCDAGEEMQRTFPPCSSRRTEQEGDGDTAPWGSLQNPAWRAPGFKGKEAGDHHTGDETLWGLAKTGLPWQVPGRALGTAACAVGPDSPQNPTAGIHCASRKGQEFSHPAGSAHLNWRSPCASRLAAGGTAQPMSVPFAGHNSHCPCPIPIAGAQDSKMLVRKDKSLANSTGGWQDLPFSLPPS